MNNTKLLCFCLLPLFIGLFCIAPLAWAQSAVDASDGSAFNPGVRGQNPYRLLNTTNWNNLWDLTVGASSRGPAGGLDADTYDWRDHDSGSGWGADRGEQFTTLQFLEKTRDTGAFPVFTANMWGGGYRISGFDPNGWTWNCTYDNPEGLAADWVRYTNLILPNYRQGQEASLTGENLRVYNSISDWSGRAKLLAPGEAQTPKVTYWEIGNEPEIGTIGYLVHNHHLSSSAYATRYAGIANAMKAVDPTIKTGPCIIYPTGSSAYITAVKNSGAPMDFISYHPYYNSLQSAWGSTSGLTNALRNFKGYLNGQAVAARNAAGDPNIELMASEWNPMMWDASSEQQRSMAMALGVVEGVFSFIQDDVEAAHFWEQAQGKASVDAMYDALRDHLGGKLIADSTDLGGNPDNDNWRVYVTRDDETFQTVLWGLNFNEDTDVTKLIDLDNLPWGIESVTLMRYGTDGTGDTGLQSFTGLGWDTEDLTAGFDPDNVSLEMYDAELTMLVIQHVPEPASLGLLGFGGLALLKRRRRA